MPKFGKVKTPLIKKKTILNTGGENQKSDIKKKQDEQSNKQDNLKSNDNQDDDKSQNIEKSQNGEKQSSPSQISSRMSQINKKKSINEKQSFSKPKIEIQNKKSDEVERTASKDNWNYFVGDSDYKTDFFLRFQSPLTQQIYQRNLISSSTYSLRLMLIFLSLIKIFTLYIMNQVTTFSLPSCIISKDGGIQICNESFENLFEKSFKLKSTPGNLLKFIANDQIARDKLTKYVQMLYQKGQPQAGKKALNEDKVSNEPMEIELILKRENVQAGFQPDQKKENLESTSKSVTSNLVVEDYYNKYEAFKMTLSVVQFKYKKCIMINIQSINDEKARFRLLSQHLNLLGQVIIGNQRRMEAQHRKLIASQQDEISSHIGEYLGNSQMMLNKIYQLQSYLKNRSNQYDLKTENYNLIDEIDFCIDGLTASKWDKEIEVYLTKGTLPNMVVGDQQRFRICLRTMFDFGLRYLVDNKMQVKCEILEIKEIIPKKRHFIIQFTLVLTKNSQFNLEAVQILFNENKKNEIDAQMLNAFNQQDGATFENNYDSIISQKYQMISQHVRDFGIGMIIFPDVVKQLLGQHFISGDLGEDKDDTLDQGKIKIGFKIPLEPATGSDNETSQKSYQINKSMHESDGNNKIYKTPGPSTRSLVKNGEQGIRNNMRGMIGLTSNANNVPKVPIPQIQSKSFQSNSSIQPLSLNKPQSKSAVNQVFKLDNEKLNEVAEPQKQQYQSNPQSLQTSKSVENIGSFNVTGANQQFQTAKVVEKKQAPKISNMRSILLDNAKIDGPKKVDIQKQKSIEYVDLQKQSPAIAQDNQSQDNLKGSLSKSDVQSPQSNNINAKQQPMSFSFMEGAGSINVNSDNNSNNHIVQTLNEQNKQTNNKKSLANYINGQSNNRVLLSEIEEVVNSNKSNEDVSIFKNTNTLMDLSQNLGIKIPESISMDAQIPFLEQNKKNGQELDKNASLSSEAPFNFHLEKFDSFMMISLEDDDTNISKGQGFNVLKNSLGKRSRPLSYYFKQNVYDKFQELPCASKNRFNFDSSVLSQNNISQSQSKEISKSVDIEQKNEEQSQSQSQLQKSQELQESSIKEEPLQKKEEKKEEAKQQIETVQIQQKQKRKAITVFLPKKDNKLDNEDQYYSQTRTYLKKVNSNQKLQIQYSSNGQEYINKINNKINEKTLEEIKKKFKTTDESELKQKRLINSFLKNIILFPPFSNAQYDSMDGSQQLKNLKETLEELDQWYKMNQRNQQIYVANPGIQKQDQNNTNADQKDLSMPSTNRNNEIQRKQIMLIVEDNVFIQMAIIEQLKNLDVEYETAINGQEGVQIVERYLLQGKTFDIILMDLIMPTMNGYQASEQIRQLEKKYNIFDSDRLFICACSSQVSLVVEKKCLECGMDDIVPKPFNQKALERMLSEHDRRKKYLNQTNAPQAVSPICESRKDYQTIQQINIENGILMKNNNLTKSSNNQNAPCSIGELEESNFNNNKANDSILPIEMNRTIVEKKAQDQQKNSFNKI